MHPSMNHDKDKQDKPSLRSVLETKAANGVPIQFGTVSPSLLIKTSLENSVQSSNKAELMLSSTSEEKSIQFGTVSPSLLLKTSLENSLKSSSKAELMLSSSREEKPIHFSTVSPSKTSWMMRSSLQSYNKALLSTELVLCFTREEKPSSRYDEADEIQPREKKSLYDFYRDPVNESFKARDRLQILADKAFEDGRNEEGASYQIQVNEIHEQGVKLQEQAFDSLFKYRNWMFFDKHEVTLYLWCFLPDEAITLVKKYLYRCSRVRAIKCLIVVTENCELETLMRVRKLFENESIIPGDGSTETSSIIHFHGRRKFKFLEDRDFQELILKEMKGSGPTLVDRLDVLNKALFPSHKKECSSLIRNFAQTQKARIQGIQYLAGVKLVSSFRETVQLFEEMSVGLFKQARKCRSAGNDHQGDLYDFEGRTCEEIAGVERELLVSRILEIKHKKKWIEVIVDLHYLHRNEGVTVVMNHLFQCSNIYAVYALKIITGWGSGKETKIEEAMAKFGISRKDAEERMAVLKKEVADLMVNESMQPSRACRDWRNPGRVTFAFNGRKDFLFLEDSVYREYVLSDMLF